MDLVGLGWRSEMAVSIFEYLDQIDVVEVIIDDYFKAPKDKIHTLRTLQTQIPVIYHGVGLGLASASRVNNHKLDQIARVFDFLKPERWSEHLAFVRADNIEIGHLSAPPRNEHTVEGTLRNLEILEKKLGLKPTLENISTLIQPPLSNMSEGQWVNKIIHESKSEMLLDLHNIYSNAVNTRTDVWKYLSEFDLSNVRIIHLSGGHFIDEPKQYSSYIGAQRLLDDHIHDVPDIVFEMLGHVAEKIKHPLTVIIERDGRYPEFKHLLHQIQKARATLRRAREKELLHEC